MQGMKLRREATKEDVSDATEFAILALIKSHTYEYEKIMKDRLDYIVNRRHR